MQAFVESRGGKVLVSLPADARVLDTDCIRYECGNGHVRELPWRAVRKGRDCIQCFRRRKGYWALDEYSRYAEGRGGQLLTEGLKEIRYRTRLSFRCEAGHTWSTMAFNVRLNGTWCAKCASQRQRVTLETVRELARTRGGELLSEEYVNAHAVLTWKCAAGHIFRANWNHVTRPGWCPACQERRGERIVRAHFEALFGRTFPKSRPAWLKGLSGKPLELDGFSEELSIAFEHQGMHHYRTVNHYGRATNLSRVQAHDAIKRRLCRKHGIALIEVPEVGSKTPLRNLRAFIVERCAELSVSIPRSRIAVPIDTDTTFATLAENERFAEIKTLVESRGGVLLSEQYLGARRPVRVRCKCGHEWEAAYHTLKKSWCRLCGNVRSQDRMRGVPRAGDKSVSVFDKAKAIAKRNKIACLSASYTTARTPMKWRCKTCGYTWTATTDAIRQGRGCRKCSTKRAAVKLSLTIEEMQVMAKDRDGECLSRNYLGANRKLRWRHNACGSIFWTSPSSIRSAGSWCPSCARKRGDLKRSKHTIEEMKTLAQRQDGECLSDAYKGASTPLAWRHSPCGTVFRTTPAHVLSGTWCPKCRRRDAAESRRYTLNDMRAVAKRMDGKCLADAYQGIHVPVSWRHNACGRVFQMSFCNVLHRGSWCPSCSRKAGGVKARATKRRNAKRGE